MTLIILIYYGLALFLLRYPTYNSSFYLYFYLPILPQFYFYTISLFLYLPVHQSSILFLLMLASLIDILMQEISDTILLLIFLILFYSGNCKPYLFSLLFIAILAFFSYQGKIGFGDIKLLFILSFSLQERFFLFLAISCFFVLLTNKKDEETIPFIPYLTLSYLIVNLFLWVY
ncbi:MAG: prepilin peptidase [Solobacterium sp.]|nr:prepilin peptidase [Solobacterium sp.]